LFQIGNYIYVYNIMQYALKMFITLYLCFKSIHQLLFPHG